MGNETMTCNETSYLSKRLGSCVNCPTGCSKCLNNDFAASPPSLCRSCSKDYILNMGRCEKLCS